MTAVHNPAPLSTTAPTSSIPSSTVVSTPKRERNSTSQENMLQDIGSTVQSIPSNTPSSNQSYQPHLTVQQNNPFSYPQHLYQQQPTSSSQQTNQQQQLPQLAQNQQNQVAPSTSTHIQTNQQQSSTNTLQPLSINQSQSSHSLHPSQQQPTSNSFPSHKSQISTGHSSQNPSQIPHSANPYPSNQQNVTQVSAQMHNMRPPQLPQPQMSQQRLTHQQSQHLQPVVSQGQHQNNRNGQSQGIQQGQSRAFTTHTQMAPPSLPALSNQGSHGFTYSQQPMQLHQSHQQSHVMLPALGQNHFKQEDTEIGEDIMGLSSLQTNRLQDISSALVSNGIQHEPLQNGNDPSVMEALIQADPEPDPLNMNVHLQMSFNMDPQRSIERQVLPHSDGDGMSRRDLTMQNAAMNHAANSLQHTNPSFSMQLPNSMPPLSYSGQPGTIPHPQVLLHDAQPFPGFQMQNASKSGTDGSLMMIGRPGGRGNQHQSILQVSQQDDLQRRQVFGGTNQMSIQDLTKPKTENQETHFSPASPSYSAVTISPPTLLQTSQAIPKTVTTTIVPPSQATGESPTSVSTPPGLSCQICKTRFTRRYNLKVHMTSKHSDKRDFQCDQCPNAFNRVDSLKRHIATTHRKEKKWSCKLCHKNFGQRPHMKMHIDTVHLKKRDHICHCGKAFGTRYNLNAHQRTHLQTPKKHLCLVCKKSFALKSSLARHQRNASHTPPADVQQAAQQAAQQHQQQQMNNHQMNGGINHDQATAMTTNQTNGQQVNINVTEQTSVHQSQGNSTDGPNTSVPAVSGVPSGVPLTRLPRLSN